MIRYEGSLGDVLENPSVEEVERLILAPPVDYWTSGCGGARLLFSDLGRESHLLIATRSEDSALYLKYLDTSHGEVTWLSVGDATRLADVIECADGWQASSGLFVLRQQAWLAIRAFVERGDRSDALAWIRSTAMPPEGNW